MATRKKAPALTTGETIATYKGFDKDLACRGFQFEIGKTYTVTGKIEACRRGFHGCEMPLDVWRYYGPATSRYATVEQTGDLSRHDEDSKIASASITVQAEIALPEIIKRAVAWIMERAKGNTATGYSGHAAATGDYGHAAATGNSGHAAATGNYGHAAATGNYGHAAATGYYGHAAATGNSGHAAATGNCGHAAVKGQNAIAAALGIKSTAQAEAGGAIMLAAYDDECRLVAVFSSLVGQNGIEAGRSYRLRPDGIPELVDGQL